MSELSYLEAIRAALVEALDTDERVFLLGEDIATYGVGSPGTELEFAL